MSINVISEAVNILSNAFKRRTYTFLRYERFYVRKSRYLHPEQNSSEGDRGDVARINKSTESIFNHSPKKTETLKESPKQLLDNSASFHDSSNRSNRRIEDVWDSDPYPKGSNWKQSQAKHSVRPKCDPRETSVILFPGQGSQFVGMGKELLQYPLVKDMYELASSVLGYNLLSLCIDGPKNTLDQTLFCQPAVLVTSLACLEKLRATDPSAVNSCIATAGFSVGEIAALVFAKALTFENAVKLVKIRAEAMQLASEMTPSGMMTVFFGPSSRLKSACLDARNHCKTLGFEESECQIANFLYPDCKVIAGNKEALSFIERNAADYDLRRLKRLPVSGAFHTSLMEPASKVLKNALKKIPVQSPIIPVHSNIDGKRYRNSEHIVKSLPLQMVKPVYWEQTMHILYERNKEQHYPKTFECGPGTSLKSILRMVNAKAAANCTTVSA